MVPLTGERSSTTTAPNSPAAAAFKYAWCMRDHGVADYADPRVTTNPCGSVAMAVARAGVARFINRSH